MAKIFYAYMNGHCLYASTDRPEDNHPYALRNSDGSPWAIKCLDMKATDYSTLDDLDLAKMAFEQGKETFRSMP